MLSSPLIGKPISPSDSMNLILAPPACVPYIKPHSIVAVNIGWAGISIQICRSEQSLHGSVKKYGINIISLSDMVQ